MDTSAREPRRYTFAQRLGVGGFGEVYRATLHTASVDTQVAVKLLRPEYADLGGQAALRLRDEARFLALLQHPNIVRVIDLVQLDGRLALVTEYIDGQDLRWVLHKGGPMPVRAAMEVIARVADALHAATTTPAPDGGGPMGLIHRDVKPANIHLGRHGDVKLLDFGIARTDMIGRSAATEAYALVGSGTYTPPEAILREVPTALGDIWSLALSGFEAISGERMFPGLELRDLARLVVRGDPRGHVTYRLDAMGLPPEVRQLLLDMTEVEPADRPNALEVMRRADELADALDGPTLRRWALDHGWTAVVPPKGPLDGRTMTEETIGFDAAVEDTERAIKLPKVELQPPPTPAPAPSRSHVSAPPQADSGDDDEPLPVVRTDPWLQALIAVGALAGVAAVFGVGALVIGAMSSSSAPEPILVAPTPAAAAAPAPPPAPEPAVPEDPGADDSDVATAEPEPAPEPAPEPEPAPVVAPPPTPAPRPAPRPTAATAPKKSTKPHPVQISANRRALVSIDGKTAGYTPYATELKPGTYQVSAMLPGQPGSKVERTLVVDGSKSMAFEF